MLATAIAGGCLYNILPQFLRRNHDPVDGLAIGVALIFISVVAALSYADLASLSTTHASAAEATGVTRVPASDFGEAAAAVATTPNSNVIVATITVFVLTAILALISELASPEVGVAK